MVVESQLKDKGINTDVIVLESLYTNERKEKILEMKKSFHKSFAFALMGQRIRVDIDSCLDQEVVNNFIQTWLSEDREQFIIFSGYWMPIVDKYLQINKNKNIRVVLCHMDAVTAASWKNFCPEDRRYEEIWLFNYNNKKITSYIDISGNEPVPFQDREDRILLHGGGWGIGNYKNIIPYKDAIPYRFDVIAYDNDDLENRDESCTYYQIDPEWKPYYNNYSKFPPLGKVIDENKISFTNNEKYSPVYNIIAKNRAIISKPGGATLIDSLSSATPIIFLDAFGKYEEKNAELWEYYGFGISFTEWQKNNFSSRILKKINLNILNYRKTLTNLVDLIYATRN